MRISSVNLTKSAGSSTFTDEIFNGNFIFRAKGNTNNIINIFTIKETKLYVPAVTLSAKDNQKLQKLLSKGFERSVY